MSEPGQTPHRTLTGPDADASFGDLVDYFATHLDHFTDEALARTAELAGHPRETIERAMDLARGRYAAAVEGARVEDAKKRARTITKVAFAVGFLLVAAPVVLATGNMYGAQGTIFIGQVVLTLVALGIALWTIGIRKGTPAGPTAAMVSLLAVPAILFIVFPGSCIYLMYSSLVVVR